MVVCAYNKGLIGMQVSGQASKIASKQAKQATLDIRNMFPQDMPASRHYGVERSVADIECRSRHGWGH
jgi:hypothetical protein